MVAAAKAASERRVAPFSQFIHLPPQKLHASNGLSAAHRNRRPGAKHQKSATNTTFWSTAC
jgi:hypothetical protein